MSIANQYEPEPVDSDNPVVWKLVIQDYRELVPENLFQEEIIKLMNERNQFGIEKHGMPLRTFNGRNPLRDSVQEILDAIVYTKQAIEEGYDLDDNLKDVYISLMKNLEIVYMLSGNRFENVDELFSSELPVSTIVEN